MLEKIKTYYIKTLGCQANERDSENLAGIFEALGLLPAKSFEDCDVAVINTCSVRQKSEDKAFGYGKQIKARTKKLTKPFTIMAGCLVGSAKSERPRISLSDLEKQLPWVDLFIAPNEIRNLPEKLIVAGVISQIDARVNLPEYERAKRSKNNLAYVNISTGCDNFCAFCVVPHARGAEKSKTKQEILEEIDFLIKRRFKKIMLVAQNVNSWGLDRKEKFQIRAGSDQKLPFADLLRTINEIDGLEKVSFLSSNPFDFTTDLVEALALPKVDRHLHLAVQSGSDQVLQTMNRRHTIVDFKKIITLIKEKIPSMTFGTDLIVGFPGETEEQFRETVDLLKWWHPSVCYIAMYSPRAGTAAWKNLKDDISKAEKLRRYNILMAEYKELSR